MLRVQRSAALNQRQTVAFVMPDIMEKLASLGAKSFVSTPEQFAALVKADIAKYAKIIKAADIKPEKRSS